ncbi:unnamed protein product [Adineta steineri]|uniref:Uncharacterized protein n=1 Tax=Adineta steineri TaxID=433720 RepID=A0A819JAK2_9BILA|nr:unnamed protein product [Adineta steineri]CAF3929560.1 unnamed protein product [Adineta steineri]
MQASTTTQQNEINPLVNMFQENSEQFYSNVDYDCLRKYDNNNEHFSMAIIIENREDEQKHAIGYSCIYGYDIYRVKLQYDLRIGIWNIFPEELSDILFHDIQTLEFNEQIETIIKRLDQQFFGLIHFNILSLSPFLKRAMEVLPIELRQSAFTCFINGVLQENPERCKVVIHDNRENEQGHIIGHHCIYRYDIITERWEIFSEELSNISFNDSQTLPTHEQLETITKPLDQRRFIESILLHVQRKKKTFEKIVDVIKGRETITMYDLGLEFLRVYDGRFNYGKGHVFVMSYREKTWSLTIDKITYVDCPVGDIGPRSVLILNYKDQYTSVHI